MKRVREYLDDTRLAIIPGSVIPNLAGASFDMLQKQRRDYYEKIPNDPRYREMRFYANPDHYDPMARLYEKTFAVRTRDHLPVHQIVWTLIRG